MNKIAAMLRQPSLLRHDLLQELDHTFQPNSIAVAVTSTATVATAEAIVTHLRSSSRITGSNRPICGLMASNPNSTPASIGRRSRTEQATDQQRGRVETVLSKEHAYRDRRRGGEKQNPFARNGVLGNEQINGDADHTPRQICRQIRKQAEWPGKENGMRRIGPENQRVFRAHHPADRLVVDAEVKPWRGSAEKIERPPIQVLMKSRPNT